VLDILVPEIGLQRAGVVALIGECITAGVPEHVWVRFEGEFGLDAGPLPRNACGFLKENASNLALKRMPIAGPKHAFANGISASILFLGPIAQRGPN
jgi:hypothetical protein